MYFLFVGCVLVNTGVLPAESGAFIRNFAELGIIFIMFALGFEESTDNFMASVKRSWGIALFGALAPFAVAYIIADYVWNDPNIALMCGLAMTATAVSLTMVSLQSLGLQQSIVATRIMTSAVLDDIGALIMVAIVVPLATGQETFSMVSMLMTAGKVTVFFVDLGAKILFDWDLLVDVMPYAIAMTIGIAVFQVLSAGLAARYTSGMNLAESLMIGFGMLGRAELAFVVIDIAYVQHRILNREAFFTLMITAFFLNILVPITITWWRPHYLRATESPEPPYGQSTP